MKSASLLLLPAIVTNVTRKGAEQASQRRFSVLCEKSLGKRRFCCYPVWTFLTVCHTLLSHADIS